MSTLQKTLEGLYTPIQKWAGGILSGRDFVRLPEDSNRNKKCENK